MKKMYILDTNVLLSNHLAPLSFGEHAVVVPLTVLEELDDIKMRKGDISRDARAAIRTLEEIIGETEENVQTGIKMGASGAHDCHEDATLIISGTPPVIGELGNDIADNIIINTAIQFQEKYELESSLVWQGKEVKGVEVVLVSNDINLRLKAKGAGVKSTQQFKNDIVIDDIDLLPPGHYHAPKGWMESLSGVDRVAFKSCGETLLPAEALPFEYPSAKLLASSWVHNEEEGWAAEIVDISDVTDDNGTFTQVTLRFVNIEQLKKRRCSGIQPQNLQQAIAINAILDRDKSLVILFGAAGSGKTLLAMAGAVEMVKGKSSYRMEEVIFSKTSDSQFEEMGFLPGDEHQKLAPWAGAVYDNMEVLARVSKNNELWPRASLEGDKAFIKLKALNFMRGRSINHRVLVIDEAQNLNAKQMRTILSRAGEHCKVILLGNLKQIDNDYLSENSSGLTYVCQKFAAWPQASIVHLQGVKRSALAAFVEDNF